MLQLIHNPLIQRLFHNCPLLYRRDGGCCGSGSWSGSWWGLKLGCSSHRVLFCSCRSVLGSSRWGLRVILLLYILEPNTWAVQRTSKQSEAVAAAEAMTPVTVGVPVTGVPEWDWRQDMVGRVYVDIGSGRQRGAAVPLWQQIGSPVDSNKKNWLVLFNCATKCSQKKKKKAHQSLNVYFETDLYPFIEQTIHFEKFWQVN